MKLYKNCLLALGNFVKINVLMNFVVMKITQVLAQADSIYCVILALNLC